MRRKPACGLRQDQRGTSLLELSLVAPFLFVLALGIFEFGNVLYSYHLISTGVHDAARYLARFDHSVAISISKETEAVQLALTGSINGGTPRVAGWDETHLTVDYDPPAGIPNPVDPVSGERPYRGGDTIWIVRVSTDVSTGGFGNLSFLGLGSTIDFNLSHAERQIGE